MIFSTRRELNMFWTKTYIKTSHISAVNISIKELVYNIQSVQRDQPPSRFSEVNPMGMFKGAYEGYYQTEY